MLDAAGPAASALLHWVYIELPVAAIVVAVWQLRHVVSGGWPRHYLVRTFLVLGLVGPLIYVVFPVVGPVFAYGVEGDGFQLGNYWPAVVPPFDPSPGAFAFDDETPRNCMPSMHTAWALAVCLHAWRGPMWMRCGGVFWLVCTLSATLGFGYHYGVDLVAGAVLCLTVEAALRDPERGWGWFRWRVVGAGALLLAVLLCGYRLLPVAMAQFPLLSAVLRTGIGRRLRVRVDGDVPHPYPARLGRTRPLRCTTLVISALSTEPDQSVSSATGTPSRTCCSR